MGLSHESGQQLSSLSFSNFVRFGDIACNKLYPLRPTTCFDAGIEVNLYLCFTEKSARSSFDAQS